MLIFSYFKLGNVENALKIIDSLNIKDLSNFGLIKFCLYLYADKDFIDTEKHFLKLFESNCSLLDKVSSSYFLGLYYLKVKNHDKAKYYLNFVIENGNDCYFSKDAKSLMVKLKK